MIYGSYDATKKSNRGIFIDQAISFIIGCLTAGFIFYLGFMTCKNIIGWVNKPMITPIQAGR